MVERDEVEILIWTRFCRRFLIQTTVIMMFSWASSFRSLLVNPLILGVFVCLGAAAIDYFTKIRLNLKSHRSLKQYFGREYNAKVSDQMQKTGISSMIHRNWFLSQKIDTELSEDALEN